MSRSFRRLATLVAVAVAAVGSPAQSQSVTGAWGGPGYSDFNAFYGFGNGYIWHTGDYWQQVVTGTGISSVSSLGLDLTFTNILNAGLSQTFDVRLNGTTVGSFTIPNAVTAYANTFAFAPVAGVGTDYTIRIEQTSATICGGCGSLRLEIPPSEYTLTGTSTVPEPATFLLLAPGLAALVAVRRRRGARAA